uniref:Uncharacterized protein n=1 Tax=viral metagenome TaxID=1070528 RepID=A0A6C0E686_9ZZZZ
MSNQNLPHYNKPIIGSGRNVCDYYLYNYYLQKYYLTDKYLDAYYLDNGVAYDNQKINIIEINNDLRIKNNIAYEKYYSEQFHRRCDHHWEVLMWMSISTISSFVTINNVKSKLCCFSFISHQEKTHIYYISRKVLDAIEDFLNNKNDEHFIGNMDYQLYKYLNNKIQLNMKKFLPNINVICPHCKIIISLNCFCSQCGWELRVYFLNNIRNNFMNGERYTCLSDNGYIIAVPILGTIIRAKDTMINAFKLPYNIHHNVWKNSSIINHIFL